MSSTDCVQEQINDNRSEEKPSLTFAANADFMSIFEPRVDKCGGCNERVVKTVAVKTYSLFF